MDGWVEREGAWMDASIRGSTYLLLLTMGTKACATGLRRRRRTLATTVRVVRRCCMLHF